MRPVTGIILGAMSFRNEYDGHAMESFSEQVERLTGRKTKLPVGDRGIQGQEGNQRDEDYDSRCTREIRQLLSEAEKTQTLLQACRHGTGNRSLKVRLPVGPQLL